MSKNLYIATTEARSGKSAVALGVMELLLKNIRKVGFFRPIIDVEKGQADRDNDITLICNHFNLPIPYEDTYAYTLPEAQALIHYGRMPDLIDGILDKYEEVSRKYDFVLCEGSDFEGITSVLEFDINAVIASNLNCPVLLVANGNRDNLDTVVRSAQMAVEAFEEKGCQVLATIVNRVGTSDSAGLVKRLRDAVRKPNLLVFTIPDDDSLRNPLMSEVVQCLNAEVLYGQNLLGRQVQSYNIAASRVVKFIADLQDGSLAITPGDRVDILLTILLAVASRAYPSMAGVVLTDGIRPEPPVDRLIRGLDAIVPILCVKEDTYATARKLSNIHPRISAGFTRKIASALNIFEKHIDAETLFKHLKAAKSSHTTPKMFEYALVQRAKEDRQHIVLPEGNEERILRAAEALLHRNVVDVTLLGDEKEIRELIAKLGLHLDGAQVVNPARSPNLEDYARTYFELRKHKGMTMESALETMVDVSFFGTMMVHKGHADGMVSGAVHTTQHTIRPALQFVRTKPGVSIVSSVFFMCLKDRVLVYGDCAVNPNPTAEELADIAIASARTAKVFGIEPLVAMLSYSTGSSGQGEEVEKVRKATKIAKEKAPDLKIEGPMQYDAAVDIEVAKTKKIESDVAGRATVFIFPDLNTGNNTYKAVQRSAGAVAIGPVLQGLNKPVNDLSRGCTIPDILNTVAITAIQAQAEKK
ncbi:MAG: phosphate acetyltransferase [Kiritimatiellae bacterium]|nr:phosphate acetyltransferase [Kiritimatiellia bacterium]